MLKKHITGAAMAMVLLSFGSARAEWKISQAPIRFTVKLNNGPTHGSAGYFVELPDGGILPKPYPKTVVFDRAGKPLKSYTLWHNSGRGLRMVFEQPKQKGDVTIYVGAAPQLSLWSPSSGLTPSAMLATHSGAGTRMDALRMANFGVVSKTVHVRNRAGAGKAPLSVPGDLSGNTGPCSVYMQAYLNVTDPGNIWVAPIIFSGGSDVRIDGKPLALKQRIKKPGGFGGFVNLSQGLHRLEIFSWDKTSNTRNGLMTLTWKTPKTSARELGGNRPSDLPFPGTPMWEARPLKGGEIVKSGNASVVKAESQGGGPVARVRLASTENYWFSGESPLFAYRLSAEGAGNPGDTRYTWRFGKDGRLDRPELTWLFAGTRMQSVTLVAEAQGKKSQCTVPFFSWTDRKTDLNRPQSRENYRRAILDMMEAYPADSDPTAGWSKAHWNNLLRTLELGKGEDLLNHIFRVRWEAIQSKLSTRQQELLLEGYLDYLPRTSPDSALKWLETLERQTRDPVSKGHVQVRRAEVYTYYKEDYDRARRILEKILIGRGTDEVSEWARIRYGDLEFMAGDLDKATRYYGDVQNRAKGNIKTKPLGVTAGALSNKPKQPPPLRGLSKSKDDIQAKRKERAAHVAAAATGAPKAGAGGRTFGIFQDNNVADWKIKALLDAAHSENVQTLVAQGYLMEAKHALREWERNFPLSKISEDLILQEAKLYMALGDYQRAAALLEPYCDLVDASSYVPQAVEILLTCKIKLQEPRESMIEFCKKMKKKLQFHPSVTRINLILSRLQAQ